MEKHGNIGTIDRENNNSVEESSKITRADYLDSSLSRVESRNLLNNAAEKQKIPGTLKCLIDEIILESDTKVDETKFSVLHEWISKERNIRLSALQNYFADIIEKGGLTPNILYMLGELEQDRNFRFISDNLLLTLHTKQVLPPLPHGELGKYILNSTEIELPTFAKELLELLSSNKNGDNIKLLKIFDFLYEYGLTIQDPSIDERIPDGSYYVGCFERVCDFLESAQGKIKNYLVQQKVADLLRMLNMDEPKEDPDIPYGNAGEASDQTIYKFRHAEESYCNYLSLGIKSGYLIENPLIDIAPNYLGYYENGKLVKAYNLPIQAMYEEKKYINENNPDDDYIYDILNTPIGLNNPQLSHPSNRLIRLDDLSDFNDELKRTNRKFYFDRSKINFGILNAMVKARILYNNQEYIKQVEGEKDLTQPLPKEKLEKLIFPVGGDIEKRMYMYKQLSQLDMRKKIEDNFRIDISKLDFMFQANFLEFLETRTIDDVNKLKSFVKSYRYDGIKTFLSIEADKEFGNSIMALGEKLDKDIAQKIFEKYSELVSQIDNVEKILNESYGKAEDKETILKIKDSILKKGKDLLVHFSDEISNGKEISADETLEYLKDIEAEATSFFLAFKTLKEKEQLPDIEKIKGLSWGSVMGGNISVEDLAQMEHIYENNYKDRQGEVGKIMENFENRSKDPNTKFYMLKHNDKVRGFIGFTPEEGGSHIHSFNIDLPLRGNSIGDTLMAKTIEQEAKENIIKGETFFNQIASRYIEEEGFIATSVDKYVTDPILKIERNDKTVYETKQRTKDGLIREYLKFELAGNSGTYEKGNYVIETGEKQTDVDMKYLDKGYVLTRYFKENTSGKERWYGVFEKKAKVVKEKAA